MANLIVIKKTNEVAIADENNKDCLCQPVSIDYDSQVKNIWLKVESRAQGWTTWYGGESFSWGELVILREGKEEGLIKIYENKIIESTEFQTHEVVVNDLGFLGKIKRGDSVALRLRTEYPRWVNIVKGWEIQLGFEKPILEIPRDLWCTYKNCKGARSCVHADNYGKCVPDCEHECAGCNQKTLAYIHSEENDNKHEQERTKEVWKQIKEETEENLKAAQAQTANVEVRDR